MRSPFTRWPKPGWVEWVYLLPGLFLVLHYAWLLDDAYVYFRYVDNLLFLGFGLVYNCGEYVEGFSSPLWCMILIALRATTLNYWVIVRAIALLTYASFWYLLVVLNRAMSTREAPVVNLPMALLAWHYGVLCYFSSGMESPFVQVWAILFSLYVLFPKSIPPQLLLAFAPLIRHEFALPVVLCLGWSWYNTGRFPWLLTGLMGFMVGSWLVFRVYYYADLFPNTYYLKNIVAPKQGLLYLHDTLAPYKGYLTFPILAVLVLYFEWRAPPQRRLFKERMMMATLGVAVAAYVVKIGGDARHFRYLAFSYVILVLTSGGLGETVAASLPRRIQPALPAFGLLIALTVAACYPRQLDRHPISRHEHHITRNGINDASPHRLNELSPLTPPYWEWGPDFNLKAYQQWDKMSLEEPYDDILVSGWCYDNFCAFDKRVVHSLGLTDPILARAALPADRPGHKYGLMVLAKHEKELLQANGGRFEVGTYRAAVENGTAPGWVARNIVSIEAVERKAHNKHNLFENIALAVSHIPRIVPGEVFFHTKVAGTNLAQNGSYELWSVGLPASWNCKYRSMVTREQAIVHDGNYAAVLSGIGERSGLWQNMHLDKRFLGQTLSGEVYVRGQSENVLFASLSYYADGQRVERRVFYPGGDLWRPIRLSVFLPMNADPGSVVFALFLKANAKGAFIVDSVNIKTATSNSSANLHEPMSSATDEEE